MIKCDPNEIPTRPRAREEAEERLRLATEGCGLGIWDWDLAKNQMIWDARMYELYGARPGDGGETVDLWSRHLHPDDRASAEQAMQAALTGSRPFAEVFRVIGQDGAVRHIRGAGAVTRDASGQAVRMIGINWDVTAKKLLEAELVEAELAARTAKTAREQLTRDLARSREEAEHLGSLLLEKNRFRAAVEAVGGVLWTNDAEGRMVGAQEAWGALTGQTPEEYQGFGWADAIHPDDAYPTIDAWKTALAERRTFVFEHRVRRVDGAWRNFAMRAVPLINDEDQNIVEWVGVHIDITEQRQTESELRNINVDLKEGAEELSTLAQGMPNLCWMAHADGYIYWYNQRWYEYTGSSPAEMEGWGWQSVHDPKTLPAVLELWRNSIATGSVFEMTFPLRGSDGAFRPFLTRVAPVYDAHGNVRRWLGVNIDVYEVQEMHAELERRVLARTSELRRLTAELTLARDAADQANQAKSRFLSNMSHELRTPLNGILGYAEMLRLEGGLNTSQTGRVDAMMGAGKHLLGMISSVLEMSRIEANQVMLNMTEIDPVEIAEECIDVIGSAAELKGLSLSLSMVRGAPRRLTTDPTRLRQMLLNLLGNAVKFTAHGSVELRLRPLPGGEGLRIEVADTGPGVAAELLPRLFQDFERLDSNANAAIEGSGLGLALSARLVALVGGSIGHENRPDGGSVFWVELPLGVAASFPAQAASGEMSPAPPNAMQDVRVLVADDVEMNREIAQVFLGKAGCHVTCVAGGAEAVAAATAGDYDVILMDVRMPEMNGIEATRLIRALTGMRGRAPIVALTAETFAEQVSECLKAGMDGHLSKPFTQAAILQAVAGAVAARREI